MTWLAVVAHTLLRTTLHTMPVDQPPEHFEPSAVVTAQPLSLLGADFHVEFEVGLPTGFSTFFAANGGPIFHQVGGDAGLRWYPSRRALSGFFLEVHGSVFGLLQEDPVASTSPWLMLGAGPAAGFTATLGRLAFSLGAGLSVWHEASNFGHAGQVYSGRQSPAAFMFLPGLQVPAGPVAVSPTLRFALGVAL